MKKITILFMLFVSLKMQAQKAYILPSNPNLNDTITIFVDLTQCNQPCPLLNTTDDLYMWTWKPKEHSSGHLLANGTWSSSNELLKMTKVNDNLYSYKMVPTQFYEVTVAQIYANDFSLLLKKKDGSAVGGTEQKTEDLTIPIDPPILAATKVSCFPKNVATDSVNVGSDDVFTLIYDNTQEEKVSMQNINEVYAYIVAEATDGNEYKIASSVNQVGNFDQLKMKLLSQGKFKLSLVPTKFFNLPNGVKIKVLKFQLSKKIISNSNDAVDGLFIFRLKNDC